VHSALRVGKFLHKVLPEYHSDITRHLISSVLFSFVYSALRSASHRHKRCTIRTSRHSPRFDRNHPQSPSRKSLIIRTSRLRFCNPFVIRTCEKKGRGDSPSSDPLHRSVPFALLHSRFQQLTRSQWFDHSLSRNTRGGYQRQTQGSSTREYPKDDIRPVCPVIEAKEQRHEWFYPLPGRLPDHRKENEHREACPASGGRKPIAISLLLLRVLSSSQLAANRRLAVCCVSTSRKNGRQQQIDTT
jgi:hypothetical protein